ncbi:MAG: glycosyltransferase family 2 protein [Terriglobia bacterium]|nr:MAG: glycosyltransferase family 2 protein [Terriglobia bacterium]
MIVPCYNEERTVGAVLESLLSFGYTVVAVDDGSTDNSWKVTCTLPVHALRHPINLGQGAALQTGMSYALREGAALVVHFDADGQHAAEQIGDLVAPILSGEADVVLGSRFLRKSDSELVPFVRALVLKAGIVINGLLTGMWLHDTHNGFRALSARAARAIRLRESGFAHATEILAELRGARLRVVECPVTVRYTEYALSKGQPMRNAVNIVVDLCLRKLFR